MLRTSVLCGILSLLSAGGAWTQDLDFHSSNASLNESFRWAKGQALHYVRSNGSIGPWYEAALPGRNAFCMRDVSHQTEGAAALGLSDANRNMLHRFAESAAASRDWAAYWEIDGDGNASAFDYKSDADFWFTLPANFDVLDAATRMWRWTGDDFYRSDPAFQSFYRQTLTHYIAQWQLEPDAIPTRTRIANQHQPKGEFVNSRGIPSYVEGPSDFTFGTDLLAAEYRAMRSYKEIATGEQNEELALRSQATADEIQHMLETVAWDAKHGHFYGSIRPDLTGYGSGDTLALYFDAVKDPGHIRGALDYIANPAYWSTINIEEETYVPLVLFRYARPDAAYRVLFDLTAPGKLRREYPEVSYSAIAAIVSGVMGIEPSHAGDDYDVQTLAQPPTKSDELSISGLPIKANRLEIAHSGDRSTRLSNTSGPSIRWKAAFAGNHAQLLVNGHPVKATPDRSRAGLQACFAIVIVKPGKTAVVSVESSEPTTAAAQSSPTTRTF